MNRTFYLYKHDKRTQQFSINPEYETFIFKPSLFKLNMHGNKHPIYLFWYLFTKGKYCIFYIMHHGKIIHYSHCLPGFFKFPFMTKKDLMIGPCWTDSKYRGQSLYPFALSEITKRYENKVDNIYIFTEDTNIPSQKGILKAGFKQTGILKTTKTGIYKFYPMPRQP